jgi:hypothetical protein
MKNVVDINEHKQLKNDFEILTAKHRETLHLVLFKVFIKNIYILLDLFKSVCLYFYFLLYFYLEKSTICYI